MGDDVFMADLTVLKEFDIQVLKLANFLRVSVSTSKHLVQKNINTFIRKFGIREAKKERYKNKSKDKDLTDI